MKRIEDNSDRQVAFSKKRKELIKEVKQLSDLCDVQVAGIVFSNTGKQYEFSNSNSSVAAILQQYHDVSDAEGREATGIHEHKKSESASNQANANLLQRVQRYLDESNLDQLTVDDIVQLEIQMETALAEIRATRDSTNTQKMMDQMATLQEKVELAREENRVLLQEMTALLEGNISATDMDNNREGDKESLSLANNEENDSALQDANNEENDSAVQDTLMLFP